ncbi:MAG: IS66-like element accessory protein TnpA [Terriglobales bacterium]
MQTARLPRVEATFAPESSVARVARANGVNANQLYFWRRQYQAGKLGAEAQAGQALVPVRVAAEPRMRQRREAHAGPGAIEVELRQGRLRVEAGADAGLLRLLLGLLA